MVHKNLKSFHFHSTPKPTPQEMESIPIKTRCFVETKDKVDIFSMKVFIFQTHYLCHFFFRGCTIIHPSGSCSSGFGCSSISMLSLVVVVFCSIFSSSSSTSSRASAPLSTLHFDKSHLGRAWRRRLISASQSPLEDVELQSL